MGPDFMRALNPVRRYICDDCEYTYLGLRLESRERTAAKWSQRTHLSWQPTCPRCGSAEVRRTDPRKLRFGLWALLWRLFGMRSYQCSQCRGQFFSVHSAAPEVEVQPPDD